MYQAIVVGSDGSTTARGAVNEAARLARAFSAPLHLVSAYQPPASVAAASMSAAGLGAAPEEWTVAARSVVEDQLAAAALALQDDGVKVETYAFPGNPVAAILGVASTVNADLIVVGSRGMSGARRVLGSVPNSVAHKAECAVLIVKTC